MERSSVQKLARVVRVLIIIVFVCNVIALLLVPGFAALAAYGGIRMVKDSIFGALASGEGRLIPVFFVYAWEGVWTETPRYAAMMTVYLWICGVCTAIILWQAKRVLSTILKEDTFSMGNAKNMKRAAVCCFIISTVALVYVIFGLWLYAGEAVFLTFSFMLIFVFLVAGLICLVMSALFRQAAEMKAENDLTI